MIKELKVYDAIKPKLGEDEAKMLLELIETKVDTEATRELVTKAHLTAALNQTESKMTAALNQTESKMESKMTAALNQIESKMTAALNQLESKMTAALNQTESKTTASISQAESRIIWKLLAISGGQLAILLAILKLFAT